MSCRPPILREGDLIRVVSPSLPSLAFGGPRVENAVRNLEAWGFRVDFSRHSCEISDDAMAAGTPEQRAEDLMEAFVDPEVRAVVSAVGGASSHQLLPHLDPDVLRDHPTAFLGRSDNVAISAYLHERCDLVSYSGVSFLYQLGDDQVLAPTRASFLEVLAANGPVELVSAPRRTAGSRDWRTAGTQSTAQPLDRKGYAAWLQPGQASAPVVGAEAAMLPWLVRDRLIRPEGNILWCDVGRPDLEWTETNLSEVSRLADLSKVAGVLVADNPWQDFAEWTQFLVDVLPRLGVRADVPVHVGGDLGHYDPTWVLPYGDELTLDSDVGLRYERAVAKPESARPGSATRPFLPSRLNTREP